MAVVLEHRRGTTAERLAITLASAELFFDTTLNALYVGDGTTAGGLPVGGGAAALRLVSKTSNYTVLTSDNGTYFNNIGAGGTVIFSLPAGAAGLSYSFLVDASQILRILAVGGDFIAQGTLNSASGGNIQSNLPCSFLTLVCYKATQWAVTSSEGSWTVT